MAGTRHGAGRTDDNGVDRVDLCDAIDPVEDRDDTCRYVLSLVHATVELLTNAIAHAPVPGFAGARGAPTLCPPRCG